MRNPSHFVKSGLVLLGIVGLSGAAIAQAILVKGSVLDRSSQRPVQYASVEVWRANSVLVTGTLTDQNGNYALPDVKLNAFSLKIHLLGYQATKLTPVPTSGSKTLNYPPVYLTEAAVS